MVLETIPLYAKLAGLVLFVFRVGDIKKAARSGVSRWAAPVVRDLAGHGGEPSRYCRSSFAQGMKLSRPSDRHDSNVAAPLRCCAVCLAVLVTVTPSSSVRRNNYDSRRTDTQRLF